MSENQPINPEDKHNNQQIIPLKSSSEYHNAKDINPYLERNQPTYTEEKIKLNLNLNSKPFKSKAIGNKNGKNLQNIPENFGYNNNGYYYNNYLNPFDNYNSDMINMDINYNYNNKFNIPKAYLEANNKENTFTPKPAEEQKILKANLKLKSKVFIPSFKRDKKDENSNKLKLNINAIYYKTQNTQLKEKENSELQNKEEQEIIGKDSITLKNKKFSFEHILQFRKWKICTEDKLLTKEVKTHFEGFKEEIRECRKNKKEKEDTTIKNAKNKINIKFKKNEKQTINIEKLVEKDLIEPKPENKQNVLKEDLKNLLGSLTHDNYQQIKKEIFEKIKGRVEDQVIFLDVLFQQVVLEKAFVELYSNLVKDLNKDLPQKTEFKKIKKCSEMRMILTDNFIPFLRFENNEQFIEYIKVKYGEERPKKLRMFLLGYAYFLTELMKVKVISKKVGTFFLKNLFERYQNSEKDKIMKETILEAIIVFSENFGRIIYEEKTIKPQDREEIIKQLDDIFTKLEKIKEEPNIFRYIKNKIVNLLEKKTTIGQ